MLYVFLDLETTGLDPDRHCPIEIALRVLGQGFADTGLSFHSLIRPALGAASAADDTAMAMHRESGLFVAARDTGRFCGDVERDIVSLLGSRDRQQPPLTLAGNSVHFDRGFLRKHMPRLEAMFTHRHLDVSAVRKCIEFLTGTDPLDYDKKRAHRAIDDVSETVAELQHYGRRLSL